MYDQEKIKALDMTVLYDLVEALNYPALQNHQHVPSGNSCFLSWPHLC